MKRSVREVTASVLALLLLLEIWLSSLSHLHQLLLTVLWGLGLVQGIDGVGRSTDPDSPSDRAPPEDPKTQTVAEMVKRGMPW